MTMANQGRHSRVSDDFSEGGTFQAGSPPIDQVLELVSIVVDGAVIETDRVLVPRTYPGPPFSKLPDSLRPTARSGKKRAWS